MLQSLLAVAPTMLEYVPAGHWTQASLDVAVNASEYVPAGQAEHVCALGSEKVPSPQVWAVTRVSERSVRVADDMGNASHGASQAARLAAVTLARPSNTV